MCKVSVLLPVRDGERFLGKAIDSILAQSLEDFELIIVNDGSADRSGEIIETYLASDRRVRSITLEPTGLIGALNIGLEAARADLVARMDADDIALPLRLEKQLAFLEQNPEVAVVGTQRQRVDTEGRFLRSSTYPCDPEALAKLFLSGGNGLDHPTVMYRRQAVLDVGGYREPFRSAEDRDLWLRLIDHHALANIDSVLLYHRWHEGNVSTRTRYTQLFNIDFADFCSEVRRRGGQDPASGMAAGFDLCAINEPDIRTVAENLVRFHDAFRCYDEGVPLREGFNEEELLAMLPFVAAGRGPTRGKKGHKFCLFLLDHALSRDLPELARQSAAILAKQANGRRIKYFLKRPGRYWRFMSLTRH